MISIDESLLVSIIPSAVACIFFIAKMNSAIKTNEQILDIKLKYMEDVLDRTDRSINDAVTIVKNELKGEIEEIRKDLGTMQASLNKDINTVESNLKEDVARLEATQAKSNCIKERLATVEVKVEGLERCYEQTQDDIEDLEEQLDDKE